jgi:hypothetical protein
MAALGSNADARGLLTNNDVKSENSLFQNSSRLQLHSGEMGDYPIAPEENKRKWLLKLNLQNQV